MPKFRMAISFAAIVFITAPAYGQKSRDTLRIPAGEQYSGLSPYDMPTNDAQPFYYSVYSPLLVFNEHTRKLQPELASSWQRVNNTTLEFELRDDITLHTGKHFEADDIISQIDYTIDPKTKIFSQFRYNWVKSVEKLGSYKIRVNLTQPYPLDLFTFSYRFFAIDSDVMKKLDQKTDYGRLSAASAGPYKMIANDRDKGITLERFDGLKIAHRRAPIKRVQILPVADEQTQIARLMTGQIDVLRDVSIENSKALAQQPGLEVTATAGRDYNYIWVDAIGKSGHKEFTDLRVRQALVMAIDRAQIAKKIVAGGDKMPEVMNALCFSFMVGCASSQKPYPYDPARAQKLLAEAGYPDGFDLTITTNAPYKDVAIAIAGDLRKIGIRADVQSMTLQGYTKLREEGKLTAMVAIRPTQPPETIEIMEGFFAGSRDYFQDPIILDALAKAKTIADDGERSQVLRTAVDRNNEMAYVLPIAVVQRVFAHSKDIRIGEGEVFGRTVHISDIFWK